MPDETAGEGNGTLPAGPDPILPGQAVVREEGAPGFNVIKLHALRSDGTPISEDVGVGRAGFNNHSPSVSSLTPWMQGDASARMISVAWIESTAGDSSGVGRVMWQRFAGDLAPANDNATWVADHNGIGAFGCEPAVAGLAGGETLLTWIDADGSAHGRLYPPYDFAVNGDADASAYAAVNASLADLGPVASTPDGSRRLQATETRPGHLAVMWLALADHGFVMRGSMFSTPLGPSTDGDSDGRWTATPIDEVRLPPGFTGPFSLQGAGDGSADVIVRYTDASSNAALAHRIDGPGSDGEVGRAGPEFVPDREPIARETAADIRTALADQASAEEGAHAEPPQAGGQAQPVSLMLGITDALESEPIVTAMQDGFAVTWEAPGITEDAVVIQMAMFDKNGVARRLPDGSTFITVADNALATVKPSIASAGSGAAAAYVDAGERSLVVKAYDGGGTQIGQDVVDDGASGAVSEIALGSTPGDAPGGEAELDVVYVRDDHDDHPDYGNIVLQRYRLPAEGDSNGLVALGGDGEADGTDAPVALTNQPDADPATSEDVHGRAPAVAGLDDGDLAIVWVENDGARETIRGCVLEAGGGQVLRIDLTGLLEDSGIARGTKPILLANADGDILVSWLQRDAQDDDAYVVMAALYAATGDNQWIAPEQPMRLQSFDEEPKDFFVTWADPDGSAIDVSWSTDSSGSGSGKGLLSQHFDLDGNDVGYRKKVSPSDGDRLSTEGLSAAGLVDGQIVVVYTEQSRNGDLDLAAHVVDTQTGDTSTIDMPDPDVAGGADVPAAAAAAAAFSTGVDQEIAIDLATAAGATVSHVNGVPITTAAPVDVGAGWIQLREDGWLTVSPDAGYAGPIAFNYTVGGITNAPDATSRVTVNVAGDAPPALALSNLTTTLAEDVSTAADIRLADIDISDAEVSTENFSLAGLDADLFRIVGSTLYLKAGIDLDFDTNPKLSVEIRADRSATQNQAVNFTLDVEDANDGAALDDYLTADTFVFAPGFDEAGSIDDGAREVIDMSSSAYSTFQELLDSGALMQSGEDVVITFDPTDPDSSDRITLRGIELSVLTSADFKF